MKFGKKSLTRRLKKLQSFEFLFEEEYSIGSTFHFADLREYTKNAAANEDKTTLLKIGEILNDCFKNGNDEITNDLMVTYFEGLPNRSVKVILKYVDKELKQEARSYLKNWKKFCANLRN